MRSIVSMRRLILGALVCATTSGCIAGIHAGVVTKENSNPSGLRYFLPATYFVVEQTAAGQWDARLESAVDRSREYYVQPYAYLASGKATAEFHPDGTLKSFRLESDSTAVPEAAITAIKDIQLKRDELTREEIAARGKAGFPAGDPRADSKQMLIGLDARAVHVYRLESDKLTPVAGADGKPPLATVTFESARQPGPPEMQDGLSVEPSDDRRGFTVGQRGTQFTADVAKAAFCFYTRDASGRTRPVTSERHDALVKAGTDRATAGRLVFATGELWDVHAIGLRKAGGCQPS